jgi:diguanylate cyclase (GGDEF)-like protein
MTIEKYKKEIQKLKREIELRDKKISQIQKLVSLDFLTGILNRNGFKREIEKYIREIKSSSNFKKQKRKFSITNISIIFIDLDNFKRINDEFGHDVGDKILKHFANILEDSVRETDIVVRWSGDEFILALINSEKEEAEERIKKIKETLNKKRFGKERIKISATFGVSSIFDDSRKKKYIFNLEEIIKQADIEMLKKKKEFR